MAGCSGDHGVGRAVDGRRPPSTAALLDALTALRDDGRRRPTSRCPSPGAEQADEHARELVHQLDDYLLPRLRRLDAPLLTVVGGSTGAGKSTVVNSLVRAPVSPAGVLRPTTRSPVLVCHPYDLHWFSDTRVLPELARHQRRRPRPADPAAGAARPRWTRGWPSWTPPDIDSVVAENRRLAGQLLAAADLWLFVTTAARYADAVPWDMLHAAQARGTALAVLLNRVPPGAEQEVGAHLREMLRATRAGQRAAVRGAARSAGRRPAAGAGGRAAADAGSSSWPGTPRRRAAVVRHTLDGALRSLAPAHRGPGRAGRRPGRTPRSGCARTPARPTRAP